MSLPRGLFKPGSYSINVGLFIEGVAVLDMREDAISFEISPSTSSPIDLRDGAIMPTLKWNVHSPRVEDRYASDSY